MENEYLMLAVQILTDSMNPTNLTAIIFTSFQRNSERASDSIHLPYAVSEISPPPRNLASDCCPQ